MTTALIDADVVAYRCAASLEPTRIKTEREPLELGITRADELVYRILNTTQAEKYRMFLGGSENYRKVLDPSYKSNRTAERPRYLDDVRNFLIGEWGAEVCAGYEADDGIGIAATENFIICSNDKDVKQIPGEHYNFIREEFLVVDEDTASFNFWLSMLVGDATDNVRGVRGIGRVKGHRYLSACHPGQYLSRVRELYPNGEEFLSNYNLLRILRSEEEYMEMMEWIHENKLGKSQRPELAKDSTGPDTTEVSTVDAT